MTDLDSNDDGTGAPDAAASAPPRGADTADTAPRRRHWGRWLLLVVLAVAAFAGWQAWSQLSDRAAVGDRLGQRVEILEADLAALAERQVQLRENQRGFGNRLNDASTTNKVLRDELLALGERAGQLEDMLARLADARQRGEILLRLNEVEFLLLIGAERLQLFNDPASAFAAYELADAALAGVDDPAWAGLRQTLASELDALRAAQADAPALRVARELDALQALFDTLPARPREALGSAPDDPALLRALATVVTIRRATDPIDLDPQVERLHRATLALELSLARAALAHGDRDGLRAAASRLAAPFDALFDGEALAVKNARARLDALTEAELARPLPALGESLRELRALRGLRAPLIDTPAPAPDASDATGTPSDTPAATPADATGPVTDGAAA